MDRICFSPLKTFGAPLAVLVIALLAAAPNLAQGAVVYWDIAGSPGLLPGDGKWSLAGGSDKNWSTEIGGSNLQAWKNGDDAVFQAIGPSTVQVSGAVQVNSITVNNTGYLIEGTTLTLSGNVITTNAPATITAILGGSVGLTKKGDAVLTLNGLSANTFTGATTVAAGTLFVSAGALGGTSSVSVNSGGTLLLAGSGNRLNDLAMINLAGGTLSSAGLSNTSETLGSLTLSGNSVIDFGTGTGNVLSFAGLASHSSGTTLQILGWSGPGSDRLIFGGSASSFNGAFAQSDVTFGGFGSGFKTIDLGNSTFEIVAVPEPATVLVTLALLGLVGLRERQLLSAIFHPRSRAGAIAGRR